MHCPVALQTNSSSVQLFMGSVTGMDVPNGVVESAAKFPIKGIPTINLCMFLKYPFISHPYMRKVSDCSRLNTRSILF